MVRGGTLLGVSVCLVGCVRPPPPAAPIPQLPFDDTPVSFTISGPYFTGGEWALVMVCLDAHHTVVSSAVVESSGDRRFDDMAVVWARRVRLRELAPQAALIAPCGPVRVEVHAPSEPRIMTESSSSLG